MRGSGGQTPPISSPPFWLSLMTSCLPNYHLRLNPTAPSSPGHFQLVQPRAPARSAGPSVPYRAQDAWRGMFRLLSRQYICQHFLSRLATTHCTCQPARGIGNLSLGDVARSRYPCPTAMATAAQPHISVANWAVTTSGRRRTSGRYPRSTSPDRAYSFRPRDSSRLGSIDVSLLANFRWDSGRKTPGGWRELEGLETQPGLVLDTTLPLPASLCCGIVAQR